MKEQEINITIRDFLGYPKIKRYLISDDSGESYCIEFRTESEALSYLYEEKMNDRMMNYEIFEKDDLNFFTNSFDLLIPVIEKLDLDSTEQSYISSSEKWHFQAAIMVNRNFSDAILYTEKAKTLSMAAATAIAKIIMEKSK